MLFRDRSESRTTDRLNIFVVEKGVDRFFSPLTTFNNAGGHARFYQQLRELNRLRWDRAPMA